MAEALVFTSFTESQHRSHTVVHFTAIIDAIRGSPLQLSSMVTFAGALLTGFCSSHDSYADENVDAADAYHVHL